MSELYVHTERIWSMYPGTRLGPRRGDLELDIDSMPHDLDDTIAPLTVTSGLRNGDVATFLQFIGPRGSSVTTGYLVTKSAPNGSGVLIAGDLFETSPKTWTNQRIIDTWAGLGQHDYSPADLGLQGLADYLQNRQC